MVRFNFGIDPNSTSSTTTSTQTGLVSGIGNSSQDPSFSRPPKTSYFLPENKKFEDDRLSEVPLKDKNPIPAELSPREFIPPVASKQQIPSSLEKNDSKNDSVEPVLRPPQKTGFHFPASLSNQPTEQDSVVTSPSLIPPGPIATPSIIPPVSNDLKKDPIPSSSIAIPAIQENKNITENSPSSHDLNPSKITNNMPNSVFKEDVSPPLPSLVNQNQKIVPQTSKVFDFSSLQEKIFQLEKVIQTLFEKNQSLQTQVDTFSVFLKKYQEENISLKEDILSQIQILKDFPKN